jgi:uncharacterized protein (DUF1684 family)
MYKKRDATPAWFLLVISCLGVLLLSGKPDISASNERSDPMEGREKKLRAFRQEREQFFKEDARSPLKTSDRQKFQGLRYYPIDLRYAMVSTIERYAVEPKRLYVSLPTSKGTEKRYVKYGRFKFRWMGKDFTLQIYRPLGGGDLFLPFKDKTSDTETYPKGRYLLIEPMPEGRVLVDFNRAHNPFCEYNEKYMCTFAPEENWLAFEVRAGEKRFR